MIVMDDRFGLYHLHPSLARTQTSIWNIEPRGFLMASARRKPLTHTRDIARERAQAPLHPAVLCLTKKNHCVHIPHERDQQIHKTLQIVFNATKLVKVGAENIGRNEIMLRMPVQTLENTAPKFQDRDGLVGKQMPFHVMHTGAQERQLARRLKCRNVRGEIFKNVRVGADARKNGRCRIVVWTMPYGLQKSPNDFRRRRSFGQDEIKVSVHRVGNVVVEGDEKWLPRHLALRRDDMRPIAAVEGEHQINGGILEDSFVKDDPLAARQKVVGSGNRHRRKVRYTFSERSKNLMQTPRRTKRVAVNPHIVHQKNVASHLHLLPRLS